MIPLQAVGKTYLLEFKHRKRLGKRPELYAGAPLNGVTTCAIVGTDEKERPFVALGTAICVREDNFSRPYGRDQAFSDAILKCGMLRSPIAQELVVAFKERFPAKPVRVGSVAITEEQRTLLKEGGRETRERRRAAKFIRVVEIADEAPEQGT